MPLAQRLGLTRLRIVDIIVVVLLILLADAPGFALALLLILVRPGWLISNLILGVVLVLVAGSSGLVLTAFLALVGFGRAHHEDRRGDLALPLRQATPCTPSKQGAAQEESGLHWTPDADLRSALVGDNPYLLNDICEEPDPWRPMSIYLTGDPSPLSSDHSLFDRTDRWSSNSSSSD